MQADRDRSGSLDMNEIHQAVQSGGFQVSPQRYGKDKMI